MRVCTTPKAWQAPRYIHVKDEPQCGSFQGLIATFFESGDRISESYVTEYSTDTIEMHTGAVKPGQRVVLVCAHTRSFATDML
jgi:hypothetical protein